MKSKSLVVEYLLYQKLIERYGLATLLGSTEKVFLPSPSVTFADADLKIAYRNLIKTLQVKKIVGPSKLSKRDDSYPLRSFARFCDFILDHLVFKLGRSHTFTLPVSLRAQGTSEILRILNQELDASAVALSLFHTAYFDTHEIYQRSQILKTKLPLCLVTNSQTKKELELSIGMKSISLDRVPKSESFPISLPRNQDQADLILYINDSLEDFCSKFSVDTTGPIRGIDPRINLLLLPHFPIRGNEAAEALRDTLIHAEGGKYL